VAGQCICASYLIYCIQEESALVLQAELQFLSVHCEHLMNTLLCCHHPQHCQKEVTDDSGDTAECAYTVGLADKSSKLHEFFHTSTSAPHKNKLQFMQQSREGTKWRVYKMRSFTSQHQNVNFSFIVIMNRLIQQHCHIDQRKHNAIFYWDTSSNTDINRHLYFTIQGIIIKPCCGKKTAL